MLVLAIHNRKGKVTEKRPTAKFYFDAIDDVYYMSPDELLVCKQTNNGILFVPRLKITI